MARLILIVILLIDRYMLYNTRSITTAIISWSYFDINHIWIIYWLILTLFIQHKLSWFLTVAILCFFKS